MRHTLVIKFAVLSALVGLNVSLPATAQLASALLPTSRSAEVGSTVTVFSTIINAGTETATGCQIDQLSALPLSVGFQTTDPTTNETTGIADTPVDLAPGQAQSFVLSVTPTAIIDSTEVEFAFTCASGESAGTITGINTLLLSASDTPVVDVVALAATAQNTGVLSLADSAGAFALATINLGAADSVIVSANTGTATLPVVLSVCETDSVTGACLASPAPTVATSIAAGGTPTFSVFSNATGAIANNPAVNRVFVQFTDSNGIVRGGTSVALENVTEDQLDDPIENPADAVDPSLLVSNAIDAQGFFLLLENLDVEEISADEVSDGVVSFSEDINCNNSGQVVIAGTSTADEAAGTANLDFTSSFTNCDGITGSTVESFMVTVSQAGLITNEFTLTGSLSTPECSAISFSEFRTVTIVDTSNPIDGSLGPIATGEVGGVCEGETVSCSFNETDLNDDQAVENSCGL